MPLDSTSRAAAVGVGVKNVQFQPAAETLPRKILIIGTYDPLKTAVVDEVPVQVLSAEDAGDQFGFGFMVHRLAVRAFEGGRGVPVYVQPQSEAGGAVAATGDFDFAGSDGVLAGTLYLYIAGLLVTVAVSDGDTADNLATNTVAAINAIKELPVTAVVNGVTTSQVDVTAKSKGPEGNNISIAFNLDVNQSLPTGVTVAITDMASGATNPDISTALDGLGTGDDANEAYFTDVVHGYGVDATVLNVISTYVGAGNDTTGLYAKTVSRPFRALTGDVTAGSAGLIALQAIADARKTDRANGVVVVPDSESHPSEIAALAIGHMARINQERAAQHYVDIMLEGIWPGTKADRWTSDYDNRDTAVKGGISPTRVKSGNVYLQNVVTFYRPDSVSVDSNGYREMVNISKLQNITNTMRVNFEQEKWQGIAIVNDVTKVTSTVDRTKARDVDSVKDDLVALYRAFEGKAWIADAQYSIDALKEAGSVSVRSGGDGFTITTKIILSGVGNIVDAMIEFDTSFAVLQ